MGGAEILHFAATGPPSTLSKIKGFLAEAPLIALHPATRPWKLTVIVGRLLGRLLPHYHMVQPLNHEFLSRDPEVCKTLHDDDLCHDTGTLEGLACMLDRAEDLESGKVMIKDGSLSVWISHGTDDRICDWRAAKGFFDRMDVRDKEWKEYDGWYHRCKCDFVI